MELYPVMEDNNIPLLTDTKLSTFLIFIFLVGKTDLYSYLKENSYHQPTSKIFVNYGPLWSNNGKALFSSVQFLLAKH